MLTGNILATVIAAATLTSFLHDLGPRNALAGALHTRSGLASARRIDPQDARPARTARVCPLRRTSPRVDRRTAHPIVDR